MYNVQTNEKISEGEAENLIFDACRANEARADWKNAKGFAVSFRLRVDGDHEAALRNPEGEVVALAVVDAFDC